MANEDNNYSMEPSGGSRLLGVNQLQSSLDRLTSAITGLGTKMGGGGGWSGSGATFNNTGSFQTANGGGTNGGGPSFSGGATLGGVSSGGNGGWGGAAVMAGMGGIGALGGMFGMAKGLASVGGPLMANNSNIGTYQAISNYRMQAGLGLANNPAAMTRLMNLAGYGNHTLNIAANAGDAGAGMATLLYNSGSYGGGLNASGRNMFTMSGGMGITTPGMTFAQGSALAAQFYSPQTSMQMRMMGFGISPLAFGGKSNSTASVYQGMMQRWFGRNSVSAARLQSNFGANGEITAQLAQMGITGANAVAMQNSMLAYDKLRNRGLSVNAINNVFSGAATHNRAALSQLQAAGIDVNNITQLQKNAAAINTQRAGGQEAAYQSGLAESTGLLNQFNSALNGLLNGPLRGFMHGVNWVRGFQGGARGMPSSSGGAAGNTAGTMGGGGVSSASSIVSGAASSAVGFAKQELGVPYGWGMEQPGVGFDCSGLVQWAYKQAGVTLPRTSQAQWAALMGKHSIPMNAVQAGDLVFTAGSDGTASSPGHVAMAISSNQLIQAEQSGTRIQITPYNPSGWQHAARPTGSAASGSSNAGTGTGGGATVNLASGMGFGYTDASLSSQSEGSALAAQLSGTLSGMLGNTGYAGTGAAATGSSGSGNAAGGGSSNPATLAGSAGSIQKLMQSMAAASPYRWTGAQWTDLYNVEMREAGFNLNAKNPTSSAYGLAQFINGPSEYYQYGGNPNTASGQITGFLNYVKSRYGTPAGAWAHEQGYGWYARGTENAAPGLAVLGERGAELAQLPGGTKIYTAGQTSGLLAGIQSGQMGLAGGGSGVCVNVTVAQGAIQMNGLGGGGSPPGTPGISATDTQAIGQAITDAVEKAMARSTLMQKLAAGVS